MVLFWIWKVTPATVEAVAEAVDDVDVDEAVEDVEFALEVELTELIELDVEFPEDMDVELTALELEFV